MVILTVIDRFIIKDLLGDEAAGIYGAGYKLGMFMSLVITAFRYAWYPFYLSTAATESNAKQIFSKIFTYFVFVCLSIFLLISFFIKELVQMRIFGYTIFGEEYWPSIVIVPTILASYIFYGLYLNFQIGIYLTNKTKNLAIITIISALINIILNYLLIPYMGISGAALTTLVSYGFMAITIYFISNKLYNIHYEWKRITQITLITLTIFFTSQVTFIDNSFILKLVLFISYFIILISTGFFEKHEFKVLNEVIRKKIWHN